MLLFANMVVACLRLKCKGQRLKRSIVQDSTAGGFVKGFTLGKKSLVLKLWNLSPTFVKCCSYARMA